jgi:hypothetical protein
VRSHAAQLVELAARHGITPGVRLPRQAPGHVVGDRDLFDVFEFQRAATDLSGAEATLYSDGAVENDHVSLDLVTSTPL